MAKAVLGIGASHTTLMNTQWDKVDHLDRAHGFRDALSQSKALLHDAKPDAVIVVGSNHFRGYWLDMMPSFSIGVGEVHAAGEHGTPSGLQAVDESSAIAICNNLVKSQFDVAFSTRLSIDHGISHSIQWIIGEQKLPVIPIVVNCFAPPLPSLSRCLDFGVALGHAIRELPDSMRVAIIATGGLSHTLPFPDWRTPQSDNDAFLVDSWKNGRGQWSDYEDRRRSIVVNAPPKLNQVFDLQFLDLFQSGDLSKLPGQFSDDQLAAEAGNGANEIRAWLTMAAALNHPTGEVLCYSPMPEWLTGMAVAIAKP